MTEKTFDLTKYPNLDIKSITMRQINGNDTVEAASRCIPMDGKPLDPQMFSLMMRQQTIVQSIVAINGKRCEGPPIGDYMGWANRTVEFVGEIHDYMNGMSREERDNFRATLVASSRPTSDSSVAQ